MKNKRIKIKHRKYNLYPRKKSKSRRVVTAILTVAVLAALCVLGYGLGRPLVDYFQNRRNESQTSSAWTPPPSAEISSTSEEAAEQSSEEAAEPTEEAEQQSSVFILPEGAADNSDSLKSALAAAKNGGYTDITVTLKDEVGSFLYKTTVSGVPESQISGSLTAKQIADIIISSGFTPHARINTLLDRTSQTIDGKTVCYMIADGGIWHDFYVAQGGKSWLDPFNENTAEYLSAVTAELSNAGFRSVVLANMRYPEFNPQDYTNFLRQLSISDDNARLEALWNVTDACIAAAEPYGTEIMLEMGSNELFAESQALTAAELSGSRENLKNAVLLVDYTPDSNADYTSVKAFIGRLSAMYSGQRFAVRLQTSGFSSDLLADVKRSFADSGITVFSE